MESTTGQDALTQQDWFSVVRRTQRLPLRPFPGRADLPIIVGVRMSLSFPGLIAAVPLQAVDYSRPANKDVVEAQQRWRDEHPHATPEDGAEATPGLTYQANWFSDGGICANLPLQFFDSALPRRPTFAINLAPFPHGQEKSA